MKRLLPLLAVALLVLVSSARPQEPDSCCVTRGDVNHDGYTNVGDIVFFVNYLFGGGPYSPCPIEADVAGTGNPIEINLADLIYLVNYGYRHGPPPPPCPNDSLFLLPFGETVVHPTLNLSMTLDAVDDGRCPSDVLCFAPGRALFDLALVDPAGAHAIPLLISGGIEGVLPEPSRVPVAAFGYRFVPMGLFPHPLLSQWPDSIPAALYAAFISITAYSPPPGFDGEVEFTTSSALTYIDSFPYDSLAVSGDTVHVWVSYTGGCKDHYFTLYAQGNAPYDYILHHVSDVDPCDMWITERLSFKLEP